jgi:hypothetical protein
LHVRESTGELSEDGSGWGICELEVTGYKLQVG